MKPNRIALALSSAFVALLLAGCGDKKEEAASAPPVVKTTMPPPTQTPATTPQFTESPADKAAADKMASAAPPDPNNPPPAAPFAKGGGGSMTAEEALAQVPKLDPKFALMDRDMREKQGMLRQAPGDAKAKTAYAESAYKYGHALTLGPTTAPQNIQYRAALALYRRALQADPTHALSLADKKTIEDIYSSMGRPIPQ